MTPSLQYSDYLDEAEAHHILERFTSPLFGRNRQVLWSGILRVEAQRWADAHGMQTLTTVMGPLLSWDGVGTKTRAKPARGWSNYVKGASILFAQHIAMGDQVTVLCPPPPERMHPSGATNYQMLEEPFIRSTVGRARPLNIQMCHPTVPGAEDYCYEIWPSDNTEQWTARFGEVSFKIRPWRRVPKQVAQVMPGAVVPIWQTSEVALTGSTSAPLLSSTANDCKLTEAESQNGLRSTWTRSKYVLSLLICWQKAAMIFRKLYRSIARRMTLAYHQLVRVAAVSCSNIRLKSGFMHSRNSTSVTCGAQSKLGRFGETGSPHVASPAKTTTKNDAGNAYPASVSTAPHTMIVNTTVSVDSGDTTKSRASVPAFTEPKAIVLKNMSKTVEPQDGAAKSILSKGTAILTGSSNRKITSMATKKKPSENEFLGTMAPTLPPGSACTQTQKKNNNKKKKKN